MSDDIFQGYKGKALELLKKYKVRVWGKCEIETTRGKFEGTVLPRLTTKKPTIKSRKKNSHIQRVYQRSNFLEQEEPLPPVLITEPELSFLLSHRANCMAQSLNWPTSVIWRPKKCLLFSARTWARSNTLPWPRPLRKKSKMGWTALSLDMGPIRFSIQPQPYHSWFKTRRYPSFIGPPKLRCCAKPDACHVHSGSFGYS